MKKPTIFVSGVFLGIVLLLLFQDIRVNGHPWGFPLDDAWIHMTFGRNLAHGLNFGINPHQFSGASTSATWSLWVAVLHLALGGFGLKAVIAGVKLSGVLLGLLALGGAMRIIQVFFQDSWMTRGLGILVLGAYPIGWAALSGMEVPLTMALCTWAFAFQLEGCGSPTNPGKKTAAAFLWTVATLTRPENLVLAILGIVLMANDGSEGFFKGLLRLILVSLPLVLFYSFVYWHFSGSPFPSTLAAKMTERAIPWLLGQGRWAEIPVTLISSMKKDLAESVIFVLGENPFCLLAISFFPVLLVKKIRGNPESLSSGVFRTLFLGWLGFPLLAVLVGWVGGQEFYSLFHGRYLAHTLFLAGIASCVATGWAYEGLKKPKWVLLIFLVFLGFFVERQMDLAGRYARECGNINSLQVNLGLWMAKNLPGAATAAVNDIGAVAYFSGKPIIDLEGLATPESLSWRRAGKIDLFCEKVQPDVLAIFPYWYPEIMKASGTFIPRLSWTVEKNETGGGEQLVLFTMPWSKNLSPTFASPLSRTIPSAVPVPGR